MEGKTVTVELIYWYWGIVIRALEQKGLAAEMKVKAGVLEQLVVRILTQTREKRPRKSLSRTQRILGGSKRAVTLFAGEWQIVIQALTILGDRTLILEEEKLAGELGAEITSQMERQLRGE